MRTMLYAAAIVCLTAPALAQEMNVLGGPGKMRTQDEVDQETKTNGDYQKTMKTLPDQKASKDPWGNVRSNGTAQTGQKQNASQTGQKQKKTGTQ